MVIDRPSCMCELRDTPPPACLQERGRGVGTGTGIGIGTGIGAKYPGCAQQYVMSKRAQSQRSGDSQSEWYAHCLGNRRNPSLTRYCGTVPRDGCSPIERAENSRLCSMAPACTGDRCEKARGARKREKTDDSLWRIRCAARDHFRPRGHMDRCTDCERKENIHRSQPLP